MITGQTDDTLHEVLMILKGILENDDVTALERTIRQHLFKPGASAAKDELVDQEMVANQERGLHGGGRNLESLDNKAGAEERKNHGYQQGLEIFGKTGLIASMETTLLIGDHLLVNKF